MNKRLSRPTGVAIIYIYAAVLTYILLIKFQLHKHENFELAMAYEICGIFVLSLYVLKALASETINTLCLRAITFVTAFYMVCHNILTVCFITIPGVYF